MKKAQDTSEKKDEVVSSVTHQRVQTAEGWKRSQAKQLKDVKKVKKTAA